MSPYVFSSANFFVTFVKICPFSERMIKCSGLVPARKRGMKYLLHFSDQLATRKCEHRDMKYKTNG